MSGTRELQARALRERWMLDVPLLAFIVFILMFLVPAIAFAVPDEMSTSAVPPQESGVGSGSVVPPQAVLIGGDNAANAVLD